ncbi:polysaccharide deacetylase family protein [Salinicoccus halitifaciens]|uniref:Peptidoglycan/xylan/chitin deacetylase (PgdA/CDA1 family) n=1 Tax=Salinicoccus halitifaciens TaxID=1073415 RepID=A0ABV2E845_9STAP|nr:polysaccharide deacetylase family protein [Salinicoccus halitifaciens]MCD2137728.1 polysaccharide deacetylase family protein [Salinicoccus halitifaciens]
MMKHIFMLMFVLLLAACGGAGDEEDAEQPEAPEDQAAEESEGEAAGEEAAPEEGTADETEATEETEPGFSYEVHPETFQIVPIDDADPEVALITIDDAPDGQAVEMAETLSEMDAGAIFFVNGMFIQDEAGQEALEEIHAMGFEIGNHTTTHPYLNQITPEETREEITVTSDLIEEITGERPRFFRAPFGINTEESVRIAEEEGMTLMNWTYGYDWEADYQDPGALADIMVNTELLTDGANLLMHDREWTAAALPDIVEGLEAEGYEIVDPENIESMETEDSE